MACTALTRGRQLNCNRISGGIKAVYFAVLDQIVSITYDTTAAPNGVREIDDIDMGSDSIYKYSLPIGTSSLSDNIVGSRENGTIYFTPTINIVYNKLSKEDQQEIKLLAATKTVVFAELNQQLANGHNVIVALGTTNGMELNAGTMDSGASWGDRNGYTLTFDGMEADPFAMLTDYTATPFDNADSGAQIPIISTGL
jgi:hypothetical protein|tara:strand:- start:48 stop:641 length:594 start_codon:yes stop_codon:yes gene_type:complete